MSRFFLTGFLALLSFPWMEMAMASGRSCDRPRLKTPVAVRVPAPDEVTVATQNLWRLFDDVDDGGQVLSPARYALKRAKLSRQIVDVLHVPDVVAVQEVESRQVLSVLAADVAARSGRAPYQVLVLEGADPGGIDVGFLVRPDWRVVSVSQLLATLRLAGKPLFDRPPLHVVLDDGHGGRLELVNVHLKSLKGSEHPGKAQRIAEKRRQQAAALAGWWRQYQRTRPGVPLLILGDFNATPDVLGGVDVLGMLRSAGLVMASDRLADEERYTYVYRCLPQLIDNILASSGMVPRISDMTVSRGNADAGARVPEAPSTAAGSSDHDALVLYLHRH